MMKIIKLVLILIVCTLTSAQAQQGENRLTINKNDSMKTYVIEYLTIRPKAGEAIQLSR